MIGAMRLANHPRGSRKNSHKNSFIGARNVCTFMSRDIKGGPHRRTTFVSKELARYKPNSEQVGLSKGHHHHHHHHYHHLSLNCEGRWGTTDDFTTSFLHFSLFSTALWDLANSNLSIPWSCLPTSSSVCFVFFPLSLCFVRWF